MEDSYPSRTVPRPWVQRSSTTDTRPGQRHGAAPDIAQASRAGKPDESGEEIPEHWKQPEGGPHQVAVKESTYETQTHEIENFFGRRLFKYSHSFTYGHTNYIVFCFKEKNDADLFMQAFDSGPFDPRDRGGGSKWMFWYKGRVAPRRRNHSPYDFREELKCAQGLCSANGCT